MKSIGVGKVEEDEHDEVRYDVLLGNYRSDTDRARSLRVLLVLTPQKTTLSNWPLGRDLRKPYRFYACNLKFYPAKSHLFLYSTLPLRI
jgi:hypothetical protein